MNKDCPIGAANEQAIEDLQGRLNSMEGAIGKLNDKLDRIQLWLVGIFGAMALNLLAIIFRWVASQAYIQ